MLLSEVFMKSKDYVEIYMRIQIILSDYLSPEEKEERLVALNLTSEK